MQAPGVPQQRVAFLRQGRFGYEREAFELMRVEKNNFTVARMTGHREMSRSRFYA